MFSPSVFYQCCDRSPLLEQNQLRDTDTRDSVCWRLVLCRSDLESDCLSLQQQHLYSRGRCRLVLCSQICETRLLLNYYHFELCVSLAGQSGPLDHIHSVHWKKEIIASSLLSKKVNLDLYLRRTTVNNNGNVQGR